MRNIVGTVVFGIILSLHVGATCLVSHITVRGKMIGPVNGPYDLNISVLSADASDRNTWVRQDVSATGMNFKIVAWFRTESNVLKQETCNRKPNIVAVTMIRSGKVADTKILEIARDFRKADGGDFEILQPIDLRAEDDGAPSRGDSKNSSKGTGGPQ